VCNQRTLRGTGRRFSKFDNVLNRPHMLSDAPFHRRRHAQGLMDANKAVVHTKQRQGFVRSYLMRRTGKVVSLKMASTASTEPHTHDQLPS